MKSLEEVMKQIRLKNKGYRSFNNDIATGGCRYRAKDGNCCLVGVFIPDELYSKSMEGKSAETILSECNLSEYMPFNISIMSDLQTFHDYNMDSNEGEEFYKEIENYLINNVYKQELSK